MESKPKTLEELLGTTPYRKGPPPCVGWWKTRRTDNLGNHALPARRWWDGVGWSTAVSPGIDPDEHTLAAKSTRWHHPAAAYLEWCGLASQPPHEQLPLGQWYAVPPGSEPLVAVDFEASGGASVRTLRHRLKTPVVVVPRRKFPEVQARRGFPA